MTVQDVLSDPVESLGNLQDIVGIWKWIVTITDAKNWFSVFKKETKNHEDDLV